MKKLAMLMAFAMFAMVSITSCDDDDPVLPTESAQFKSFHDAMRVLWSDHAVWTRNVIINILDGAPGTNEAVNRLLANQVDIGNAIKPYYGEAGGNGLTALLNDHITIAADVLTAARDGNTDAFNTANALWYANGDDIAAFLNTANPEHFGLAEMESMMKMHLDLTLEEAVARLEGDYAADVAAYDEVFEHIMMMADMLAEGIANQFPEKF
jgi:hypothetical protein